MKLYLVIYVWDYEYSKPILVTKDKDKAEHMAKTYTHAYGSDAERYEVTEMELDKEYSI